MYTETMDPLTHILAGAAVADAMNAPTRLGRRALWFSILVAAAPDADLFPALVAAFPANPFSARLFDSGVAVLYHRTWTHALPVLAVAGVLFGVTAWLACGKPRSAMEWVALAWAALTSHTLLDLANGPVRVWLPFSDSWHGWAQAAEGNPLILLPLAVCFLTNHPPKFENRRKLGTLEFLNAAGDRFGRGIGSRIAPAPLALLVLGGIAAGLTVAHYTL